MLSAFLIDPTESRTSGTGRGSNDGSLRMKVYLDDQRPAPPGWVLARTADDAIALLREGTVTHLCLDYDLGDPAFGTGLDVLDWLESAVAERRLTLPRMTAHSGSILGCRRLEASIALLEQRFG